MHSKKDRASVLRSNERVLPTYLLDAGQGALASPNVLSFQFYEACDSHCPAVSLQKNELRIGSSLWSSTSRDSDELSSLIALLEPPLLNDPRAQQSGEYDFKQTPVKQIVKNNNGLGQGYSLQQLKAWDRQYRRSATSIHQQLIYFSTETSLKAKEEKSIEQKGAAASQPPAGDKRWTTTTNIPLPSRKLGLTPVPTPSSAPPAETNPLHRLTGTTPKSVIRKGLDLTTNASKALFSFLMKLPGNLLFYATHPAETRASWHRLRDMAKEEAHHYWVGTKLLWADMQTARNLLKKTLVGSSLTRRERKQLLRTVSDLFRLIPFSMFVIVPFMEFALPFALRIFPNMLPSTYQDSLKAEENMKRELKSRIAMAQFFQE